MAATPKPEAGKAVRVATRGSPLALAQARRVVARLEAVDPGRTYTLRPVRTAGDRRIEVPIHRMGGQGVFVREVQETLLAGEADVAVHSAKDLPSEEPPGLTIGCVPERLDAADALVLVNVGSGPASPYPRDPLAGLPPGAIVATGSVRRMAQLAWLRPDLGFVELRGNLATRLERIKERAAAGVVALAALERLDGDSELDLEGVAILPLPTAWMLPQAGQGAIAVECRSDSRELAELLDSADDAAARTALEAERAFLSALGGGCNLPVGALATVTGTEIHLEAMVARADGTALVRHAMSGSEPGALGSALATNLLDHRGGAGFLPGPPAG